MLCKFEGCRRGVRARGLCNAHYNQWVRKNYNPDLLIPIRSKGGTEGLCVGPDCNETPIARNLCRRHYNQWYARGKDLSNLTP